MSVGSAKYPNGFADIFGGRQFNAVDYSGPTAYNNTGTASTSGDTLSHRLFGFENTIQAPMNGATLDQSGTYYVIWQPKANGVTVWSLRWFVLSTNAEVANGVNLSAYTVRLSAIGF